MHASAITAAPEVLAVSSTGHIGTRISLCTSRQLPNVHMPGRPSKLHVVKWLSGQHLALAALPSRLFSPEWGEDLTRNNRKIESMLLREQMFYPRCIPRSYMYFMSGGYLLLYE